MSADQAAAGAAVQAYIDCFNARDPDAFAQTLHYPHMRVDGQGRARVWESWSDYAREVDFSRVEKTGWHHTVLDWQRVVQSGDEKVHIAVSFTRFNAVGEPLLSQESLYVVTLHDGKWAIQVRSSFLQA